MTKVNVDRSKLRWAVVLISVVAALVSLFVSARAHNNTISAEKNLCISAKIFSEFLKSDANLRQNESEIDVRFRDEEDALVRESISFWRGLSANKNLGVLAAFIQSSIELRNAENKFRKQQITENNTLVHNSVQYWDRLSHQLKTKSSCGEG